MAIYPDKKNGKNTGRWRVEVQKDGQRARGRFDTHEAAREAERAWKQDITSSRTLKARKSPHAPPMTLSELSHAARKFLFVGQASEIQSNQRLAKCIELLGDLSLSDISTSTIDDLVVLLNKKGGGAPKKPATINRYLSSFHSLLSWGHDRGFIDRLPKFQWQQESQGRIRWITRSEELKLLEGLRAYGRSDLADLVYVAIQTGMRRGELLGLETRDIDDQWVRLWETKTRVPRSVPVAPKTRQILTKLVAKGMPTLHDLRYWWDKVRTDMGLTDDPDFVFHACRHTCATRLVQANVHIRVIQKFLGHSRIETTMRYAQVDDRMLSGALEQLVSHQDAVLTRSELASPTSPPQAERGRSPDNVTSIFSGQSRTKALNKQAGVVELVDTQDLGSQD